MINKSELRIGHFTSSGAYKLIPFQSRPMTPEEKKKHKEKYPKSQKRNISIDGFGDGGMTYIKQKRHERKIGRSMSTEIKTRPILWGSVMEIVLFDLLGMEYSMQHKSTMQHKEYGDFWSGTPDLIVPDVKIGEIKCFQPEHFVDLSDLLIEGDIQKIKEKEKEVYWQTVSNACIVGVDKAEIIAYMPYRTELEEIIDEMVSDPEWLMRHGLEPRDYYFLSHENIETLAYLPDDSKYSNINKLEFEIPKEDIEFITNRMIEANKILMSA